MENTKNKNGKTIVELAGVDFSYGPMRVIEKVDLIVRSRDFLGIIGPNGGGKTTILKLVLGLVSPDAGTVTVFGKSPEESRARIGYVPQLLDFDAEFPISVLDIVLMGRFSRRGLLRRYGTTDVESALISLENVGMREQAVRGIGELSGGQRQRVMIARALACEPDLLLLDEPLSNIDSKWQGDFYRLLGELNKRMAIVLVTHDITALSTYVDLVACLNRKLYYHGLTTEGIEHLTEAYECPIELIAHGIPHRVLENHDDGSSSI